MKPAERKAMLWPIYLRHMEAYNALIGAKRSAHAKNTWRAWNSAMAMLGDNAEDVLDAILGHQWDNWKDRIHNNYLHHILKHNNIERFMVWQRDPTQRPRQTSIYGAKVQKGLPHTTGVSIGTLRRMGQPGSPEYHRIQRVSGIDPAGNPIWEEIGR